MSQTKPPLTIHLVRRQGDGSSAVAVQTLQQCLAIMRIARLFRLFACFCRLGHVFCFYVFRLRHCLRSSSTAGFSLSAVTALVDSMTVYAKDRIVFRLTCGMEIES